MKKTTLFLFLATLGFCANAYSDDVKPYPLKTCIVSGEGLPTKRKPIAAIYEGQEVLFCCRECKADFQANPEKFIKKIPASN